ncbi:MAG: acyltransferase family protein, partial [Actinomycetota bacterium]|nr:acyltransferase family protein [Actinomycetota bacterium]
MGDREAGWGFRPDVEGLRGVAVLAVVLYHAAFPGLTGGFVGVDVFFVISGFLITGLLWQELMTTGTVRLARFYGARVRRLLPAAITVLVVVVVASAWWLPSLRARSVLVDALASAVYAGNYRFALRGTDYLAADGPASPLQHFWSLGVEEQFYLLWPALLIVTVWIARPAHGLLCRGGAHRRMLPGPSVTPVTLAVIGVALVSVLASLHWTYTAGPWAFFSLPSRAWELAIGGLIALSVPLCRQLPSTLAALAGWTGLALILLACVRLGSSTPYPGVAALLPVLGTALVIAGGCAQPHEGVGLALSQRPLRQLGRYSYSWYLWHWPVLVLAPVVTGHALSLEARAAAVALSAGLAVLTTHAVEDPVRFAACLRCCPARSLLVGGATTALGLIATLLAFLAVPIPVGPGAPTHAPRLSVTAAPRAPAQEPAGITPRAATVFSPLQALTAQVQAIVAASADTQVVPSNLTPSLPEAADDKALPFLDGCLLTWTAIRQSNCTYGDTASSTTVALIGDSHATQWFPTLEHIAQQRQWRLETFTKTTCPLLVDLPIHSPYLAREYTECEQWRTKILDRIQAQRPALVILGMSRRYAQDFHFTTYGTQWLTSLTRTVAQIHATGATVLVLGPIPDPLASVPTCLSAHLDSVSACAPDRTSAINAAGIKAEQAATAAG